MQRFAREDADDGGDEQQQRRQKKMQDLRAFNSPDEFPRDLRPSKVGFCICMRQYLWLASRRALRALFV